MLIKLKIDDIIGLIESLYRWIFFHVEYKFLILENMIVKTLLAENLN